jgi:antitoxin component of MazEF toxin-antitoxin module
MSVFGLFALEFCGKQTLCLCGNYMKTKLVRIGNSRGLRLPRRLLALYGIDENNVLDLEERAEGILIRPASKPDGKLAWEPAYNEMASDIAESSEWSE